MKAHVCAWSYEGGGGFDWYFTAEAADKAFEEEQGNCLNPRLFAEGWTAYRFDVEVQDGLSNDEVTNAIDADLIELCDKATIKFRAEQPVFAISGVSEMVN